MQTPTAKPTSTRLKPDCKQGKLLRKQYNAFSEFVADVAQICHNAQVYNRPSAPIFGAAVRLREVFQEKLQQLVQKGQITADDATLPDLGDLPPVDETSDNQQDMEKEVEDDDDEKELDNESDEGESDESDEDDMGRPKGRGRRVTSAAGRRGQDGNFYNDTSKKRGRPPYLLTPMESRIHAILRGLRKFKANDGSLLVVPFEKLPDKAVLPDYYQIIAQPIALETIKMKAKRKRYSSVDHVMGDLELMFRNAMLYNEDDSPVHQAAVELQRQARALADEEKAKPDEDFRDEHGRLPLDSIEYKGHTWRVGKSSLLSPFLLFRPVH